MLRNGVGAQGVPPSQVLVGLALFMTAFVMYPVAAQVNDRAVAPYFAGKLDEAGALAAATPPLRTFLLSHTAQSDLALFYEASHAERPTTAADRAAARSPVPAFMLSELRIALEMGLIVLLPFLVIDLVVATVLSRWAWLMMPPTVVALPIKLLVFVSIDAGTWSSARCCVGCRRERVAAPRSVAGTRSPPG